MLFKTYKEQQVEKILYARDKARQKGKERKVLVKQLRYYEPIQEPLENLVDTATIDNFKTKFGDIKTFNRLRQI